MTYYYTLEDIKNRDLNRVWDGEGLGDYYFLIGDELYTSYDCCPELFKADNEALERDFSLIGEPDFTSHTILEFISICSEPIDFENLRVDMVIKDVANTNYMRLFELTSDVAHFKYITRGGTLKTRSIVKDNFNSQEMMNIKVLEMEQ